MTLYSQAEQDALIPDETVLDQYEPRKIRGMWDLDLLHYAKMKQKNVILYGPTGSAKTTLARAYASREGLPFYSIPMNGAVVLSQLLGKWVPNPDGGFEWVNGPVSHIVENGGVLLFDELNYAPAKILSGLFSLFDSRRMLTLLDHRGEHIEAHPDLLIVAAMNKGSEYEGIRPLSAALWNRFPIKVPFGYDAKVEANLLPGMSSLRAMGNQLREAFKKNEISTPISTNMLLEFAEFAQDPLLGQAFAEANFVDAFEDVDRPSVRQVLDLRSSQIARDLADSEEVSA